MNGGQISRRRMLKLGISLAGAASVASLLAACETTDADDDDAVDEPDDDEIVDDDSEEAESAAAEPDDADDDGPRVVEIDGVEIELPDGWEPFELSELDMDTLQGEVPDATLEARPWDNTWVGEVTDDLFIGLRIAEAYGSDPREVVAYLCDNDISIVLEGELEDDQASLADDEAELEFELIDGEVTGTVTLAGEESVPFSAEEATGDAGVYVAEHAIEDIDVVARWIVLEDGQQRGGPFCRICHPDGRCIWWQCNHHL